MLSEYDLRSLQVRKIGPQRTSFGGQFVQLIPDMAVEVAKVILLDANQRLLIYLRDDKPTIPYPNHWDLLGGTLEPNEDPEIAAIREVQEEIGITLSEVHMFGHYTSAEGVEFHLFRAKTEAVPDELTLTEGRQLTSIEIGERNRFKFPPVLQQALDDYANS